MLRLVARHERGYEVCDARYLSPRITPVPKKKEASEMGNVENKKTKKTRGVDFFLCVCPAIINLSILQKRLSKKEVDSRTKPDPFAD